MGNSGFAGFPFPSYTCSENDNRRGTQTKIDRYQKQIKASERNSEDGDQAGCVITTEKKTSA